jgi:hypothetical protein
VSEINAVLEIMKSEASSGESAENYKNTGPMPFQGQKALSPGTVTDPNGEIIDVASLVKQLERWSAGEDLNSPIDDPTVKLIRLLAHENQGIRYNVRPDLVWNGVHYTAGFEPSLGGAGIVHLSLEFIKTRQDFRNAVLEELIHASTLKYLLDDSIPEYHMAAEHLRLTVLARLRLLSPEMLQAVKKFGIIVKDGEHISITPAELKEIEYWLSNTAEFLAGITNATFRDVLSRMQTGGKRDPGMDMTGKKKSIFTNLVESLLVPMKKYDRTMVDEVFALLERKGDGFTHMRMTSDFVFVVNQEKYFHDLLNRLIEGGAEAEHMYSAMLAYPALAEYAGKKYYDSLLMGETDIWTIANHMAQEAEHRKREIPRMQKYLANKEHEEKSADAQEIEQEMHKAFVEMTQEMNANDSVFLSLRSIPSSTNMPT